jgi:hypothetical protein
VLHWNEQKKKKNWESYLICFSFILYIKIIRTLKVAILKS